MGRKYWGIWTLIIIVLFNLVGCSNDNSTNIEVNTNLGVESEPDENIIASPSVTEPETEELKTEETAIKNLVDSGIYTFYNEENKSYLSYEGNNLVLSETPSNWWLNEVRKEDFYVYAKDTELMYFVTCIIMVCRDYTIIQNQR